MILSLSPERLAQKEKDWVKFGYTKEFLDSMREQKFWDAQYDKVPGYNQKISAKRSKPPAR